MLALTIQRNARRLLSIALLGSITACNHRVASEPKIDVCDMAHAAVAGYFEIVEQKSRGSEPSAGGCVFTSRNTAPVGAQANEINVQVGVLTKASLDPSNQAIDQVLHIVLAEAGQTYATPPTTELTDTAKIGAAFIPPTSSSQVVLSERGLLLEIGARGLAREKVLDMSRDIWRALLAYRPKAPAKANPTAPTRVSQ